MSGLLTIPLNVIPTLIDHPEIIPAGNRKEFVSHKKEAAETHSAASNINPLNYPFSFPGGRD
jgi:hypothetical protein